MTTETFTSTGDTIPRDRWGRPLVTPEGGGKPTAYARCTTFVDCLEDKYNLQKWQQRMVAIGITQRPDIHLQVASLAGDPDNNKGEINKACEAALEAAQASAKATIGTAVHKLTELVDRGEELGVVPDAYIADVAAYQRATDHLTMAHIEQFVVHDPWRIGGTPDRVVKTGGKLYIADVKTGSIEYGIGKIAMQLAVYARSKLYDRATGQRTMHNAELDKGIIIHLPAGSGTCRLYWVDLLAGWEGVRLARNVRSWRDRKFKDLTEPYAADFPGAPLWDLIAAADTVEALDGLWFTHRAEFDQAHIKLAAERKAALQGDTNVA